MKRIMTGVIAAIMVLTFGAAAAFAAGPGTGMGRYYIDADGDGICDNMGSWKSGYGRYYVDADGNGVCDNLGSEAYAGCCGLGRGCHRF